MRHFSKNSIIKNLDFIVKYEIFKNNLDKASEYTEFIKNLKNNNDEIHYIKDLKVIKGFTTNIKEIITEFKKFKKISYIDDVINKDDEFMNSIIEFNKKIIIKNLEFIRNYEIFNNQLLKVKAYNKVINNLHEYPNEITEIDDLDNIKGIGKYIKTMLNDLKYKSYIPYIKNVINKDEEYKKYLEKIKTKATKTINKSLIIKALETIRNYEIYNNNLDKGKAYINAINAIKDIEIKNMKDLKDIKGIGKAITLLINELINTGKIMYIENSINKDIDYKNNIEKNAKLFNKELLIKNLETIKNYEIYNNELYKVKAYSNAINNIIIYNGKLNDINDIDNIENLGPGIKEKIYELYLTGKISYIENNIKTDKIYNFKQELLNIYGIGPINAKKIIDAGITNMDELKKNSNILNDKQKIGLKYYDDIKKKIPLKEFENHLSILRKDLDSSKLTYDFVGSYRRGSKNMGDIDILIMQNDNFNLKKYISTLIDKKYIIDVLASGKNKFMGIVKLKGKPARRLDILISPPNEYYYSLLYFTGSNLFNIGLRHYVKTKFNLSLSEHGFNKPVLVNSEEDIFKFLKLQYVKPANRNKFDI